MALSFCDTDTDTIKAEVINNYEEISGRSLAPADPVRLFLESIAAIIAQQRSLMDYMAKQNLLSYAEGDYLDALGELVGVTRLEASAAITTIRYTLSEALAFAITIPAGNRTTPDGTLYFATDSATVIAAGDTYADIAATCTTTGDAGNGYIAGQITQIVDPIAYIESVANITETSNGSDIEDDDNLRERIRLAPESFSVAGSAGAYEYWAKTASSSIADVSIIAPSDEAGTVYIYVLMDGGELPTDDVLALVEETCSADTVRPVTDTVIVVAPEETSYDIDMTYYIAESDSTQAATIQTAVEDAVDEYILWQKSAIGRDIQPSKLIQLVMAAGALRVELTSPTHTVLDGTQVAVCGTSTVTFDGLEEG